MIRAIGVCSACPAANGRATSIGRSTSSIDGSSRVISTRSAACACSARTASSPATPPPATMTWWAFMGITVGAPRRAGPFGRGRGCGFPATGVSARRDGAPAGTLPGVGRKIEPREVRGEAPRRHLGRRPPEGFVGDRRRAVVDGERQPHGHRIGTQQDPGAPLSGSPSAVHGTPCTRGPTGTGSDTTRSVLNRWSLRARRPCGASARAR